MIKILGVPNAYKHRWEVHRVKPPQGGTINACGVSGGDSTARAFFQIKDEAETGPRQNFTQGKECPMQPETLISQENL